MKRKIIPIMILFLLFNVIGVLGYGTRGGFCGPSTPSPIVFTLTVNGISAANNDVSVKNLATGELLTVAEVPQLKMENGIAGFDLGKFENCDESVLCECYSLANPRTGFPGDEIEVKLCDFSPSCTFKFNLDYSKMPANGRFDIVIEDSTVPVEKIIEKEVIVEVPSEPQECPIPKEPEQCPLVVCPPEKVCEAIPEPDNNDVILAAILATLGGLGIGGIGGILMGNNKPYFFKRKDGSIPNGTFIKFSDGKVVHRHYGLIIYHDPIVSHSDVKEKHPKGQLDPEYVKDSTGKYVYKA